MGLGDRIQYALKGRMQRHMAPGPVLGAGLLFLLSEPLTLLSISRAWGIGLRFSLGERCCHYQRGPRKIEAAGNRRHLWGEQPRIGPRTKRNHWRENLGCLPSDEHFSRSPKFGLAFACMPCRRFVAGEPSVLRARSRRSSHSPHNARADQRFRSQKYRFPPFPQSNRAAVA
jgi:hypothetical protein